jgi:hypothetical protein
MGADSELTFKGLVGEVVTKYSNLVERFGLEDPTATQPGSFIVKECPMLRERKRTSGRLQIKVMAIKNAVIYDPETGEHTKTDAVRVEIFNHRRRMPLRKRWLNTRSFTFYGDRISLISGETGRFDRTPLRFDHLNQLISMYPMLERFYEQTTPVSRAGTKLAA